MPDVVDSCPVCRAIENLGKLTTLRILMLGKNQIAQIEGLQSLVRLDVLDLQVCVYFKRLDMFVLRELDAGSCSARIRSCIWEVSKADAVGMS